MPDTTAAPATAQVTTGSRGLLGRVIGVLTSPRATYAEVAARPRWLGALALVLVVNVLT